MSFSRVTAAKIWQKTIEARGMDSYPLIMKWYAKRCLSHEDFLHSTNPTTLFTDHFHHERVTEMFRRLVMFFQSYLPGLRNPPEDFHPAALTYGMTIVRLHNHLAFLAPTDSAPYSLVRTCVATWTAAYMYLTQLWMTSWALRIHAKWLAIEH